MSEKYAEVLPKKVQREYLVELANTRENAIRHYLSSKPIATEQIDLLLNNTGRKQLEQPYTTWYTNFSGTPRLMGRLATEFDTTFKGNRKRIGEEYVLPLTRFGPTIEIVEGGENQLFAKDKSTKWSQYITDSLKTYREIRDLLLKHNERFIYNVASESFSRMNSSYVDDEDLLQVGKIGFVRALSRFNPNRGAAITTYSAWWIKQGVKRELERTGTVFRKPTHVHTEIGKVIQAIEQFKKTYEYEPSDEELAERMGLKESRIAVIKRTIKATNATSLDSKMSEGEGEEMYNFVADTNDAFEAQSSNERSQLVYTLIEAAGLSDKQKDVLFRRTPLPPYTKKQTLEEIGQVYNVTRERVRQIERDALLKLKSDPLKAKRKELFPELEQ